MPGGLPGVLLVGLLAALHVGLLGGCTLSAAGRTTDSPVDGSAQAAVRPPPVRSIAGNAVELLVDGPRTFDAMFAAIERATDTVRLETYIFEDDALGQRMADLLMRKRREQVGVRVLYDSVGSIGTPAAFFDRLAEAGVAVCAFNPVAPSERRPRFRRAPDRYDLDDGDDARASPNQRDHRKILVVDGATAFTGGINVSAVYASSPGSARRREAQDKRSDGWRDTHVAIAGPAAAEFGALFDDTWSQQDCDGRGRGDRQPAPRQAGPAPPAGDETVRVLASTAREPDNPLFDELIAALAGARHGVKITMGYFVPDPQLTRLLCDLARRGVAVELILPGFSDFAVVWHAGRARYAELLEAGVRIHERRDALLHAKTAVIDDAWSLVGSANLDWRSRHHNDEVAAVVLGRGFAARMTALFERDRAQATAILPDRWARRSPLLRWKEFLARIWDYWL